ncbi:methionine sulfoxide reductase [Emiliania huxleyi CCMP1516]|uniref:MsrB domain-containing protein n=2 Tax=Emiliania huxleyi TaxID=2903 RepID=A0A0D3K024_EMIH1|nr:methionine sulfoxide reductase [Emiliania huxleyi CCMP1516]EOD29109.1 methionine sulfoxide reductase [Emiliania huxleyi CCMP1516]|eukprot:XP_005781538.1 methionine sulfoxide reductase [Emiliania huxleyi CCMP1516]
MHLLGRLRLSLIGVISSGAAPSAALRLPTMAGVRMRGAGQQARMMGSVRDLNDQGVEYSVRKTEAAWREAGWREQLSDEEYYVLRQKGTEYPGSGKYDKFYPKAGHFVCGGCGAPLYSAAAKFDSGCGWPAFDRIVKGAVVTQTDTSLGMRRVEILCGSCGGHLGHVFEGETVEREIARGCARLREVGAEECGLVDVRRRRPEIACETDWLAQLIIRDCMTLPEVVRDRPRDLARVFAPLPGERFTRTNERHCVNSASVRYVDAPLPDGAAETKVLPEPEDDAAGAKSILSELIGKKGGQGD